MALGGTIFGLGSRRHLKLLEREIPAHKAYLHVVDTIAA
jgi:hypothetical protein